MLITYRGKAGLEFTDRRGFDDFIEDRAALCDAAGCRCHGPSLTCGHTDGPFYEPLFARVYAGMCFHTCYCDLLPSAVGDGAVSEIGDVEIAEAQQEHGNAATDLEAAVLGESGCLKGKSAGWTLQSAHRGFGSIFSTMADLSSLLNPAPSSEPGDQEVNESEEDVPHNGAKAPSLPPVKIGAPSVQPSIKSPLDTLADAATSSAPMLSPTNSNGIPFVSLANYNHSAPQSSSRPTSSHFSPPSSFDQFHGPAPTSPTFSPGLQQYHHPTSSEIKARRPSETAETLAESLPPLRRPFTDNNPTGTDGSADSSQQADTIEAEISSLPCVDAAAASTPDEFIGDHAKTGHALVTSQLKSPSSEPLRPEQELSLPSFQSTETQVKTEISDAIPDLTSSSIQLPAQLPQSTETEQEFTLPTPTADMKPKSSPALLGNSVQDTTLKPQPAPSRKRPAPKKGTATTVKPAAKKRKTEKATNSIEKSSPLARSGTPNSSRASKTPAPKGRKQESVTPQRSSSLAHDDDDDEDGVFCICRGPDDHTWMIACDGPCEDWFHGRCINMTEKESQLIEKYYCPNCTEACKGETLWKRMCRLEDCRRPARINGNKRSKYCSDEHGCEFMKRLALQKQEEDRKAGGNGSLSTGTPSKKGRQTNNSFANVDLSNGNDAQAAATDSIQLPATKEENSDNTKGSQNHMRGGVLQSEELKALVTGVKDISEFRKLGNGVPSPPPTANPNQSTDIKMEDAPTLEIARKNPYQVPFTPAETEHLQTLTTKKDELRARKHLLDDRDTFLVLVRERAKAVLDELKKKETIKDICGFDTRLVWLDEEFDIWRKSPEGTEALRERKLGVPMPLAVRTEMASQQQQQHEVDGNAERPPTSNGEALNHEQDLEELGKGMCRKKKCERHRYWYKLQQQEVAFAKDEVRQGMRKLDEEEKTLRDRARIRWLEGQEE
ncbi:MAG: hypothetical protein Q9170_004014 [Blastenia crenularia]